MGPLGAGDLHVIWLLHSSQYHAPREWSRDHVGVFRSISKIHRVAFGCLKEHILSSFWETKMVLHVGQDPAPEATGVDEDAAVGKEVEKLLKRVDVLADELPTESRYLLCQIRQMSCRIYDWSFVAPGAVEDRRKFRRVHLAELPGTKAVSALPSEVRSHISYIGYHSSPPNG